MRIVKLSSERLKHGPIKVNSFDKLFTVDGSTRFRVVKEVPEERYILVSTVSERSNFCTILFTGEYEECQAQPDANPSLYTHHSLEPLQ